MSSDGLDDGCGTDRLEDELEEGNGEASNGLFDGAADSSELAAIEGIDDGRAEGLEAAPLVGLLDGNADGLALAATEGLDDG